MVIYQVKEKRTAMRYVLFSATRRLRPPFGALRPASLRVGSATHCPHWLSASLRAYGSPASPYPLRGSAGDLALKLSPPTADGGAGVSCLFSFVRVRASVRVQVRPSVASLCRSPSASPRPRPAPARPPRPLVRLSCSAGRYAQNSPLRGKNFPPPAPKGVRPFPCVLFHRFKGTTT